MVKIFKQLLLWNCWADCNYISYFAPSSQHKSLFKWFWSIYQGEPHAHVWWKPIENFLIQNKETGNLETWYKASGTGGLQNWYKWWSKVDLWPFCGKVKFASLYVYMGKIYIHMVKISQSFNGRKSYNMTGETKPFFYNQNFVSWGLSAICLALHTCMKSCNKSRNK